MGRRNNDRKGSGRREEDQRAARIEEERKRVATLDDTIAAQLTNILIAGSVGAIVASVTFLKDIAPQLVRGSLCYVRIAWVALFIASALSIASLLTSRTAGKAYRDWLAALRPAPWEAIPQDVNLDYVKSTDSK